MMLAPIAGDELSMSRSTARAIRELTQQSSSTESAGQSDELTLASSSVGSTQVIPVTLKGAVGSTLVIPVTLDVLK